MSVLIEEPQVDAKKKGSAQAAKAAGAGGG